MRNVIKKKIEFNRDNIDWFEENYPYASLSGLLNLLLERYRHLHPAKFHDLPTIAAQQVKDEL